MNDSESAGEAEALPVLSLWQPHASLVALNLKTVETRNRPAPKTIAGKRIAIQATKRKPDIMPIGPYGVLPSHRVAKEVAPDTDFCLWGDEGWLPLPLGCIVATARLVASVPIRAVDERLAIGWERHVAPTYHGDLWIWEGPSDTENPSTGRPFWVTEDISDQEPYGDFTPGRWAWLLDGIEQVDPPMPFVGGQGFSRRWVRP